MTALLLTVRISALALILTMFGHPRAPLAAAVSGQVILLERPGDRTEDLAGAVVFLEPARIGSAALPRAKVVMALEKRQFSPRVRVITTGSTVAFPNEDRFSHNVFSKTNGGFDTDVFGRGKTKEQTFTEPGVYSLYCNVHPRMTGFVIALRTPYYTQPGADGRFSIENVPPGDYHLIAWHERATLDTIAVTVPAEGLGNVRVELDARAYHYVQHKNKYGQDYTSASGDRY